MTTDKKKKIAIFLPNLDGGGAERTMLNLALGLDRRGHNIDLVLAQADGPYMVDVPASLKLVDLGRGVVLHRAKTVRRLPALIKYLRREKPYVMLSALVEANVVGLCARRFARTPKRVVVNEQNNLSTKTGNAPNQTERLYPLIARFVYPWADCVVGVSQGVVDDLLENVGIAAKNSQVIYNPGITAQVREKAKMPLDHPWFKPGQPPVILSVGSLSQQKDFGTLLQAFNKVRQQQPCRLLILGEGEERESLEKKISDLDFPDDVSLPGFVENPYAYMSKAAVYALSSRWEGLPTVLVEALYCGALLVATDCPSGPDEILQSGKYGVLVPTQDPDALAVGIISALNGTSPRADSECWRRFESEYIVDQYVELLLGQGSAG